MSLLAVDVVPKNSTGGQSSGQEQGQEDLRKKAGRLGQSASAQAETRKAAAEAVAAKLEEAALARA